MKVTHLGLGVIEIAPVFHRDSRGHFAEVWHAGRFREIGIEEHWVQENQSLSNSPNVLRGMHFQLGSSAQSKLVRVLSGSIFDVAIDVRSGSATFGKWVSRELNASSANQLYIPKGFAHGFLTLSSSAEVLYKTSEHYCPALERSVAWNDPSIGIDWPLEDGVSPILSEKDAAAPLLSEIEDRLTFD